MEQARAAAEAAGTDVSGNDGILYRARPHLLALLWPFALFAASAALALIAERHVPGIGPRLGFRADQAASFETACRGLLLATAIIFALNALAAAIECRTTTYVVTASCVVASSRLLRSTSTTIYLAKIEAVVRDQGPVERLCDAGAITLVSTGGGRDTLTHVRDLSRFAAAIERTLSRAD